MGLGANVKIFDNSITKLRRLQNHLPQRIFTSTIQPKSLLKALRRCDVAIGAMRGKERCADHSDRNYGGAYEKRGRDC